MNEVDYFVSKTGQVRIVITQEGFVITNVKTLSLYIFYRLMFSNLNGSIKVIECWYTHNKNKRQFKGYGSVAEKRTKTER